MMSIKIPQMINILLCEVQDAKLYHDLIEQINKDFLLANENLNLTKTTTPKMLKKQLQDTCYKLIQHNYDCFLNILYIIDVPEEEIKQQPETDLLVFTEHITFLILKREWKKIWFKKNYTHSF